MIDKVFDDSIKCSAEGYITDISMGGDKIQFVIDAHKVIINDKIYADKANIKVYGTDTSGLKIGDCINVSGKLNKLSRPTNQGQFNEEKYYTIRGIKYKLFLEDYKIIDNVKMSILPSIRYSIKGKLSFLRNKCVKIYDKILPKNQANLMKAMILGEKSYLSIDTKSRYSESGISHVLAISGLHIAILGYGFFRLI
jgi:competence protein ComEC